jgi:hypothetical protein
MAIDDEHLPPGMTKLPDGGYSYNPAKDPNYGHRGPGELTPEQKAQFEIQAHLDAVMAATYGDPDSIQRYITEVIKPEPDSALASALNKLRQEQLTRRR